MDNRKIQQLLARHLFNWREIITAFSLMIFSIPVPLSLLPVSPLSLTDSQYLCYQSLQQHSVPGRKGPFKTRLRPGRSEVSSCLPIHFMYFFFFFTYVRVSLSCSIDLHALRSQIPSPIHFIPLAPFFPDVQPLILLALYESALTTSEHSPRFSILFRALKRTRN